MATSAQTLTAAKDLSLAAQARIRFFQNKAAVFGLVTLGVIAVLAIMVPIAWPHGISDASFANLVQPPSLGDWHWFGTDANGRDLFVRTFYGARISLMVGLTATLVALVIGVT